MANEDWSEGLGKCVAWVQERYLGPEGDEYDETGFVTAFVLLRLSIEYPQIAAGILERARGDAPPHPAREASI